MKRKKIYTAPSIMILVTEDLCTLTSASIVTGDNDTSIDSFPIEGENKDDSWWDSPDNWGGD